MSENAPRKSLVVVNTGNGKGKTTAALGLTLRAAGNDMKVLVIQFIKGRWKTGESKIIEALAPNVQLVRMGMGFTIERLRDKRIPMEEHEEAAHDKRNWVRLTYDCNNGCIFCLDSQAHDGDMRDAVTDKFLEKPMTKEPVAEFYPFPALGK